MAMITTRNITTRLSSLPISTRRRDDLSPPHILPYVEYNVSYVYHALYANSDRDSVALKGLANVVVAMELVLSLKKLVNAKLLNLHSVRSQSNSYVFARPLLQ
ncbi:unnamed protein product [Cochlearia groenlandica]